MNINPLVEKAFKDFTVDGEKIPIFFMHYDGKSAKYLTYYQWSETPTLFTDNSNQNEAAYGTIDVWSSGNYKNIVEATKETLKQNNFTWTDTASEMYESDTGYYHIPINFYINSFDISSST
jgi:hypothetical protein